jgi:hypothetical protein
MVIYKVIKEMNKVSQFVWAHGVKRIINDNELITRFIGNSKELLLFEILLIPNQ